MRRIELSEVLKQMEKDSKIYSASRDALDHKKEDYLVTLTYPDFTRMMYRDGFMASHITIRAKWTMMVASGIIRQATDNYARLDMHAFNKAVGLAECYIYTYTHTQPADKPAVTEASQ